MRRMFGVKLSMLQTEYDNFLDAIKLTACGDAARIKKTVKVFEAAEKQHIAKLKTMSEDSDSPMNAFLARNELEGVKRFKYGVNGAAFRGHKNSTELTALCMDWAVDEAVHTLRFAYLFMLKVAAMERAAAE